MSSGGLWQPEDENPSRRLKLSTAIKRKNDQEEVFGDASEREQQK
jgi:hypothetical protein